MKDDEREDDYEPGSFGDLDSGGRSGERFRSESFCKKGVLTIKKPTLWGLLTCAAALGGIAAIMIVLSLPRLGREPFQAERYLPLFQMPPAPRPSAASNRPRSNMDPTKPTEDHKTTDGHANCQPATWSSNTTKWPSSANSCRHGSRFLELTVLQP
jgi:hypothetical protein